MILSSLYLSCGPTGYITTDGVMMRSQGTAGTIRAGVDSLTHL